MNEEEKQELLNTKLAQILTEQGIRKFRITNIGNSIASGYSQGRTIKPLLDRNESLKHIMLIHKIAPEIYNFTRAQNNSDEHIYEWILNNIKLSEISQINRHDYGMSESSMREYPKDQLEQIWPYEVLTNPGLKEAIFEKDNKLANIIVYNGCTGSFLDIWSRSDSITYSLKKALTYGFKRDFTSLHAILKYIQTSNRYNGTDTQIYICGAPNIFKLKATDFIIPNKQLKKIATQYACATYVPSVCSKGIYKTFDEKTYLDIHHDELEYLKLNNNILEAITKHYKENKALIDFDRMLYRQSREIEFSSPELKHNDVYQQEYIDKLLQDSYQTIGSNKEERVSFAKRAKEYLTERAPFDYYYIGNTNISKALENRIEEESNRSHIK